MKKFGGLAAFVTIVSRNMSDEKRRVEAERLFSEVYEKGRLHGKNETLLNVIFSMKKSQKEDLLEMLREEME